MIWFTSDLHIGHRQILQYCSRPFDNMEEQTEGLIKNYNELVSSDDLVYWLGDSFFCGKEQATELLKRFNGRKILIKGNHDGSTKRMLGIGFDEAHNELWIEIAGQKVLLKHYPFYNPNSEFVPKYVDSRPIDDGSYFLIHGHSHSIVSYFGRAIDVGVDANNYRPIPVTEIEEYINKNKELLIGQV